MEKLLQEFTAVDRNGKVYRLRVFQEYASASTRADPSVEVPVGKRIVTEDGENVNRLKRGEFQIVATGVILRSSAPDAP